MPSKPYYMHDLSDDEVDALKIVDLAIGYVVKLSIFTDSALSLAHTELVAQTINADEEDAPLLAALLMTLQEAMVSRGIEVDQEPSVYDKRIADVDVLDTADRIHQVAKDIFEACGAVDDFCHQTGLVFGGTNRIILTVHGWVADRDYCTPQFLAAFDEYMGR